MKEIGDNELISLNDVSRIFDRSIDAMRKYRSLGLIEPCKRVGRKDFYKKKDIIYTKYFIDTKRAKGENLLEIAKALRAPGEELDIAIKNINNEKTKNVLIIEDTELLCEIMQKLLYKHFPENALSVYCAGDGVSGIKFAEKILPDLIILDIVLPLLSGIEVYEKLTKLPRLSHSKFIFISGGIEHKPKNEIFFSKPLKLTEFVKTVENLTGLEAAAGQSPI